MIKSILHLVKNVLHKMHLSFLSNEKYIKYLSKKGVRIGENCEIAQSADFGSEPFLIKIGNNTRITKNVQFITHDGGIWTLRRMGLVDTMAVKYGKIEIGSNCNISWNVVIMPNVKIGNNCIIAAGAIVTKDVPDNSVYGGIPAKKIETIEEYFLKNKDLLFPTYGLSEKEKIKLIKEKKPDLLN
jgi:acetyltransferase-like isoleucine patch superfamily enzyme